jgi:hypothetical protein
MAIGGTILIVDHENKEKQKQDIKTQPDQLRETEPQVPSGLSQPDSGMKWDDFLNPRSMLTPGIAGSMVMVITNTLWVEFMVPQKWTALVLSFLLIIPILLKFAASWFENIVYFVFNGLIVFSLAVNTNFAGRKVQEISANRMGIAQYFPKAFTTSRILSDSTSNALPEAHHLHQLASLSDERMITSIIQAPHQSDVKNNDVKNNSEHKKKSEEKRDQQERKKQKKQEKREFFEKWF